MKSELLAPAGDVEAGYAALYYGADAVYLGLQQFSARATATNFGEETLKDFTGYAHSLGRKVYVALNTLLQENELPDLIKNLDICSRCQVDALIIQDLGVARVVREGYPELELHASTQMAVHNKEGALALQKLGFSRVVLARELTLPEIKEIAAIPGLETEAFIHGALCYSYSGLCLFSSVETGRSANRGKCLYPCRANFKGEDGEKHYFSMKDMALQEDVLKMPVTSLKIEGRKKTALYVAAVTDYYRKILDGKGAQALGEENIKQIFSRPWCKFHFNGRDKNVIDRDFVGHRGLIIGKIEHATPKKIVFKTSHQVARYDGIQIDVEGQEKPFGFSLQMIKKDGRNVYEALAGDVVEIGLPPKAPQLKKGQDIYLASSSFVKGAYHYQKPKAGEYKPRLEIDVRVKVEADKVTAEANGFQSESGGRFTQADHPEKMQKTIMDAFGKTGNTELRLRSIQVDNSGGYFVSVSLLNELRRSLYEKIKFIPKAGELQPVAKREKPLASKWIVKTDDLNKISKLDLNKIAEVVVLMDEKFLIESLKNLPKNKIRLALPTVCRHVSAYKALVQNLLEQGYRKWEIGNYWGLGILPDNGVDVSFDAPIYMLNTQAMQMAKEMKATRITLSVEDTFANLQKIAEAAPLPVCLTVYQDAALFTSAGCIRSNPCKSCKREDKWMRLEKDGNKYQVLSKNCQTMLFAENALSCSEEASQIAADFYRVDFVYKPYSPEQAAEIFNLAQKFAEIPHTQKANLKRTI